MPSFFYNHSNKKIFAIIFSISILLSCINSINTLSSSSNDLIVNDIFWKDTNGNNIYSQGGGIFKFGDTYYWYGVHYQGADTYAANPSKKNKIIYIIFKFYC